MGWVGAKQMKMYFMLKSYVFHKMKIKQCLKRRLNNTFSLLKIFKYLILMLFYHKTRPNLFNVANRERTKKKISAK